MIKNRILAIDDDENFLKSLKNLIEIEDYQVTTIANPLQAEETIKNNHFDSILLDVKMPGINGLDLFQKINNLQPATPVIMISGQSDIAIAVEAIKNGVYDFVEKPVDTDKLFLTLSNAIRKKVILEENSNLLNELQESYRMVGESKAYYFLMNQINTVAPTNAKVLITGESGTGKEAVAWAIHHNSQRKSKPYLRINCASIPGELLESELFGHKKGSFTNANNDRLGKFVAADGGTIFLDEIGDMSFELQSKLLRVLENNEVEIIGQNEPRKIDIRIITATNQDLKEKIKDGTFREDLYFRLNVMNIHIPPLRQRIEDIIPIATHFLRKYSTEYNKKLIKFTPQAEGILKNQTWSGNAREVRSFIEKLVIFAPNEKIIVELTDIMFLLETSGIIKDLELENSPSLRDAKLEFERDYLQKVLDKNDWSINETAEELGIDRTNLFRKMQKHGLKK